MADGLLVRQLSQKLRPAFYTMSGRSGLVLFLKAGGWYPDRWLRRCDSIVGWM